MSTIVFMIFPAHGHVNPTLPIVKALVNKGYRVVYYGTDDMAAKIKGTGAVYREYNLRGIGFNTYAILQNMLRFSAFLFRTAFRIFRAHLAGIDALKPDCIIFDSLWAGAKAIARKLKVPFISSVPILVYDDRRILAGVSPLFLIRFFGRNLHHVFIIFVYWMLIRRYSGKFLNPFDVFANRAPLNIVYTSTYFQPDVELLDSTYCFVGPSIFDRDDGAGFPLEKLEGKIVVFLSFGTILNERPLFYRQCINEFKGDALTLVISGGGRIQTRDLGPVPPNIIVRGHVPQLEVLKKSAVFVTHAGMNSVQEALFFGVPLVMLPQTPEQGAVAARVKELGAGIVLPKNAGPRQVRTAVEKILRDPKFARSADVIGETLRRAGGYERAVSEICAYLTPSGRFIVNYLKNR
jgi:MGT family glycosyltransferase